MSYLMTRQRGVLVMFGVSFLSPLFLIGALAAAVPILLHLFHRKTEVVIDFPGGQPAEARAGRSSIGGAGCASWCCWRCASPRSLLLALSFARPYFAGAAAPDSAPLTVIAVDTSMSMSAPGQMDRARAAATRAVAAAPASHALALMAFGDAATVVVEPTTDRSAHHERHRPAGRRRHGARASAPRWRDRARSSAPAKGASSSSPICSSRDGSRTTMAGCRMAWASR